MDILKARNITKIFPGVVALDAVNITLRRGEVHCICGENGAGKSTLIKCLTGVYEPEEGEIQIDGQDVREDRKLFEKVAYVPQEIDLFPHLSVAENLFMPFFRSDIKGFISQAGLNRKAAPILERFGIRVAPFAAAKDVPVSQQQLLQVARAAVFKGYEILMLDEPTTSLTGEDTQKLFQIIRELKADGKSIVFISHKLEEVFEIGDVITVFRNGKNTGMMEVADIDIARTVKKMTGQILDEREVFYSERVSPEVLMEVRGLSGERFRDISFTLRKGEILGFSGLVGAGRSELMQAVFGYLPVYSGEVRVKRAKWKLGDTNYSVRHGMFYLPEERRTQGILSDLSIRENASVNALKYIGGRFGISRQKEEEMVSGIIESYDVKTPDMEKKIKYLSGGNQQKVIIGRAMSCKPEILIFDEPTKGIDVGTKAEIYRLMKKIAQERQVGIILISSEMNELRKCANRIISLYNGRKAGEHQKDAEEQEILRAILGLGSGGDTYAGRR
ncbi:MAG: sugar ABC transporter ATP-binding protein [Lachnospiraceae bacterium]|nr:sugar ABC transporter ATP-binding protein [Lachnospiraceae bacterium]